MNTQPLQLQSVVVRNYSAIVVVGRLLNCKRRLAQLVWNVVVTEIALRIFHIPIHEEESILKDNNESPWHDMKTIFGRTIS